MDKIGREKAYKALPPLQTVLNARKMLAEHIITEADYDKLEAAFAERYNPPLVFISPQEALL